MLTADQLCREKNWGWVGTRAARTSRALHPALQGLQERLLRHWLAGKVKQSAEHASMIPPVRPFVSTLYLSNRLAGI